MYPQVKKKYTLLFLTSNVIFADVIVFRVQNFYKNFSNSEWRLKKSNAEILGAVKETVRSYPKIKNCVC
jgi:hypothetical protein